MGVYHRERIWFSSTLSCIKEKEEITKTPRGLSPCLPKAKGRALFLKGARPFPQRGALHNLPAPFHLSTLQPSFPLHPTSPETSPICLHHQLIHPPPPPYLGHGGTTYPSTPFDMESSMAASWPRYGLLTTSQAVTMNPRSQWSLFEFGNRLNCEEICIQKFGCFSGGRGHFVLACLMGCL